MKAGERHIAQVGILRSLASRIVMLASVTALAFVTWGAGSPDATSPMDVDALDEIGGQCVWAERIVQFTPGTDAPEADLTDAANALGISDPKFVSLGQGGSIVVEFLSQTIIDRPGNDFTVFEAGLVEVGAVAVSANGSAFHALGNTTGSTTSFDIGPTGLAEVRFVRVTDNADGSSVGLSTTGFDLEAVGGGHCALQGCAFGGAVESVHMGGDLQSRRDARNALGPADGNFVSLGQGGEITLEVWPADSLDEMYPAGSLLVYEFLTTEGVSVEVSSDGTEFIHLGEIEGPGTVVELELNTIGLVRHIRIVDDANGVGAGSTTSGFDLDAIALVDCTYPVEETPVEEPEAGDSTNPNDGTSAGGDAGGDASTDGDTDGDAATGGGTSGGGGKGTDPVGDSTSTDGDTGGDAGTGGDTPGDGGAGTDPNIDGASTDGDTGGDTGTDGDTPGDGSSSGGTDPNDGGTSTDGDAGGDAGTGGDTSGDGGADGGNSSGNSARYGTAKSSGSGSGTSGSSTGTDTGSSETPDGSSGGNDDGSSDSSTSSGDESDDDADHEYASDAVYVSCPELPVTDDDPAECTEDWMPL